MFEYHYCRMIIWYIGLKKRYAMTNLFFRNSSKEIEPSVRYPCSILHRIPVSICHEKPSWYYSNIVNRQSLPSHISRSFYPTHFGDCLILIQSIINSRSENIPCSFIISEQCIKSMTNTILTQIRCSVSSEEVALLCYCLPSLIRDLMNKYSWLTSDDIIQWLISDILVPNLHLYLKFHWNLLNDRCGSWLLFFLERIQNIFKSIPDK